MRMPRAGSAAMQGVSCALCCAKRYLTLPGPLHGRFAWVAGSVQQFLERYEVGETVGVGGERGLECKCGHRAGQSTSEPTLHAIAAGFAVVKKGRDKRTGDPVAIKVGQEQGLQRKWEARNKLPAVFLSPGGGQVALRCGRQQLGARDSSAVQGASCLTACYVHVRHLQGPDRAGPACMPGGSPALHQAL